MRVGNNTSSILLLWSLYLSMEAWSSWSDHISLYFPLPISRIITFGIRAMIQDWATWLRQDQIPIILEKIAALSKITDNHEQTLQEIKKQLQTLNMFMQKWADSEEQHQQSSQSRGCLVNAMISNEGHEHLPLGPIKNLRLKFPRFQGEDHTCWIYRANQFFFISQHS